MAPVDERAREIRAHHEEPLQDVLRIVGSGEATNAEVAEQMGWSRLWPELGRWTA